MKKLLILTLIASFICNPSFSQMASSEVDQLAEKAITTFNLAGVAVGIVKDGKVIHSRGYGSSTINSDEEVTENTQFSIASNSKAFTTAALAILVDQGKISWQDKVVQYLPEFKMYNNYVTENFNIQDLLTHRSGLGLGAGDLMFIPEGTDFTIDDILTCFQHFEPQSAFRTSFDYDNLLYIVAGELIARVSGKTWEDFVKENIVKPLGMDNTYPSLSQIKDKRNLATPYLIDEGNLKRISHFNQIANGAAGGIFSSVDDLCQWMLVHLNEGKYGKDLSQQLFSEAAQREMWKIHNGYETFPNGLYNTHFSGYGLGWELCDVRGNMLAYHGGLLPGMASQVYLVPDLELGIVVLINSTSGTGFSPVEHTALTILDRYLGMDDNHWLDKIEASLQSENNDEDSIVSAVWETVETAKNGLINFQDYTGLFEDKWFGKAEVFLKDDQLWFRSYRSPKLNGKLSYYEENTFAVRWEYQDLNADAFVIFSPDEGGKAEKIKLKGISPYMDFSFDFQDLDFQRTAKED